jgi:hypothetical protein
VSSSRWSRCRLGRSPGRPQSGSRYTCTAARRKRGGTPRPGPKCGIAFDAEIRRVLCFTNAIASINARIRRAFKARGHFPNEQAALKCVYMAIMSLDPHRHRPKRGGEPGALGDHLSTSAAAYVGPSQARLLTLLPDGTVLNERAQASLLARQAGQRAFSGTSAQQFVAKDCSQRSSKALDPATTPPCDRSTRPHPPLPFLMCRPPRKDSRSGGGASCDG